MPRIPKVADDPADQVQPTSTTGGGGGTFDGMEARVSKLETEMTGIKVMFARLDERLTAMSNVMSNSFATKADVAEIRGESRGKLGFWQFLSVVVAIGALMVTWPQISRVVGGS